MEPSTEWNITQYTVARHVLGYEIKAQITRLPEEIHILVFGGSLPHIGSVSIFEDGAALQKMVPEEHRDDVVGDSWARRISREKRCRVTAACGIHYDNATPEMLRCIQHAAEELLQEALAAL